MRLIPALALMVAVAMPAAAKLPVTVHGSVSFDALFPETDEAIGTEEYNENILFNAYANVGLFSKYVDAGLRVEFTKFPLPGFEPDFKGWGVPNVYVKGKYKGFELTAGDFYEQFGSGFILRTYEERSLGIDNSIRGGRLKINALNGFRFTLLGGVQRRFWDWNVDSPLFGADAEWDMQTHIKALKDNDITLVLGASYVLKHEKDEDIMITGSDSRLNLPQNVGAWDFRAHYYRKGLDLQAEYALKSQDPSYFNNYTYGWGSALMLSGAYSKPGWSVLVQAKRSDNMSFRSKRSEDKGASWINNMPPFAYLHTYTLASMYPYATQEAPGEYALQGAFAYSFKRKTPLGGKYGTKFKLNVSYICGIDRSLAVPVIDGKTIKGTTLQGTDWYLPNTEGIGDTYYADINLQMDKKLSKVVQLNLMYMFQKYNQKVIENHGDMVTANIFVAEGKFKFSKKVTLRTELQYLHTRQDQKDWMYGLAEVSVLPYLMFSVSDQWNHGDTKLHYYMACVTGNYRSHRLMVSYGRTRAGFNCSGGVCRIVPATRGFQVAYSYTF